MIFRSKAIFPKYKICVLVGLGVAVICLISLWIGQKANNIPLALTWLLCASIVCAWLAYWKLKLLLQPVDQINLTLGQVLESKDYSLRASVEKAELFSTLVQQINNMLIFLETRDWEFQLDQEENNKLKQAAQRASSAKSEFLAMMGHELRTPLAGTVSLLKQSTREPMSSTLKDRLHLSLESSESLLNVINDMLDLSSIDAGRLEFKLEIVSLQDLVQEVLKHLQPQIDRKQLKFSLEAQVGMHSYWMADKGRLRQVLRHVIGNAVKFTEEGEIKVKLGETDLDLSSQNQSLKQLVRIEVEDTGIGIPRELHRKIFERFEQADRSATRKHDGAGLGLPVSKELIKLMGGDLNVASRLGVGSQFTITLPLEPSPVPETKAPFVITKHSHTLHVLVVEDVHINQVIIENILMEMGHRVSLAENGKLALEAMAENLFDLVLMDWRMPVMDGLEATYWIREGHYEQLTFQKRDIPIIGLTANNSPQDRDNFLKAGANIFMTKPVDEEALHQHLQDIITQMQVRGQNLLPATHSSSSLEADLNSLDALMGLDTFEPISTVAPQTSDQKHLVASQTDNPFIKQKNANLRERLMDAFRDQMPIRMAEIEQAIAKDDWKNAAIVVHGIKGSVAHIWPGSIAQMISADMEVMADEGRKTEFIANISILRAELEEELAK